MLTGHSVFAEEKNAESEGDTSEADYFAIINNQKVSAAEYIYRFRKSLREKFYHGKISKEELDNFKKEVADELVREVLLEQEAIKQGLRPDSDQVTQKLNSLDEKFTNAESEEERDSWKKDREQVLPIMKIRIERELLVTKLKEQVKNVTTPPVDEVRQYYIDNKDKFTEPQQWDVSIILLTVDPSSSPEVWEETVEKAEKILKKIRKGESFEELARIHSGDESAVDGGHMGYIHIGMLGTPAQKMLNVMEPGELSEPVVLLEGVAIFRLNDVRQANLNTFEDVQERATNLLKRELGEEAWNKLLKTVRSTADIEYNEAVSNELNVQTVGDS